MHAFQLSHSHSHSRSFHDFEDPELGPITDFAGEIVTNTNDDGPGSLRQAIANAVHGETIAFDLALSGTIQLSRELLINKDLTIRGPGPEFIAISGNNAGRVLRISGNRSITLSRIALCNGFVRGNDNVAGIGGCGFGAGLLVGRGARVTITGCMFSGNTATGGHGTHGDGSGFGGAIYSGGSRVVLVNTTFLRNKALGHGGSGGAIHFATGIEHGVRSQPDSSATTVDDVTPHAQVHERLVAAESTPSIPLPHTVNLPPPSEIPKGNLLFLTKCAFTGNTSGERRGGTFFIANGTFDTFNDGF